MRPSLRQIETFYWVARLGGFHAAARHLHLTQPTVSARIQELEDALGAELFARGKHRAELTALGGQLLPRAERILHLTDDFGQAARQSNPFQGLLRLGTNESAAAAGLITLLTRLKAEYPQLRVELTIDIGSALVRKLNARELDVAILMEPVAASHVIDVAIGHAELCWVAAKCFTGPERRLTPDDLSAMPIVLTPPPSALFSVAAQWFREGGSSLESYSTCNSVSLIRQLVAAGHAVSVLPRSIVEADVACGLVRCLPGVPRPMRGTYYVSYLCEKEGDDASTFVQLARETLAGAQLFDPLPA